MESKYFNSVALGLSGKDRGALCEAIWAGKAELVDEKTQERYVVLPDAMPAAGEHLFCVSFLGSKRDGIPTQHYMIPAVDDRTAVRRAHERYVLEPRHRKGSSLRVMLGKPPALGAPQTS
jgi:hypothetical protein